ncbi:MAG: prepilin peptidase [Planctomycetota bacterium]|nr:MAG: prepilin peptidase [Planctomycetota bacterium]
MNGFDAIPVGWRLMILAVLGFVAGGSANAVVDFLLRPYRSSSQNGGSGKVRRPSFPAYWGIVSHESFSLGRRLRYLAVAAGFAAVLPLLYWWEVEQCRHILWEGPLPDRSILYAVYTAHALLAWLMLAASLIDWDEQIIPDAIVVPGTLIGLTLAAWLPWSLLPDVVRPNLDSGFPFLVGPGRGGAYRFLTFASPRAFPDWAVGGTDWKPLVAALACWWFWCVALMPRTWYSRHGWRRALKLALARLCRSRATYWLAGLGVVGSAAIAVVWRLDGLHWQGLFSSLIGMIAAFGITWIIRIVFSLVLDREAMGFGDVTLMGMIGAFLGWQASLMAFFVAPFFGLALGLVILIATRDHRIPYGPFLCLGAATVVVFWAGIWSGTVSWFALGPILILLLVTCIVGSAFILLLWRFLRGA